MKFLAIVSCLVIATGCAEVLETPGQGINTRAMPKSYRAPTPETVVTGSNWEHVGRLETGGSTQMGRAKGLVAFDAKLVAGQDVTLRNFSGAAGPPFISSVCGMALNLGRPSSLRCSHRLSCEGRREPRGFCGAIHGPLLGDA